MRMKGFRATVTEVRGGSPGIIVGCDKYRMRKKGFRATVTR